MRRTPGRMDREVAGWRDDSRHSTRICICRELRIDNIWRKSMIASIKLASPILSFLLFFQLISQQWKEYTSQEGKFMVLLPGEPTTGFRPPGGDSRSSVTYVINLQTSTAAFDISYFDHPEPITDRAASRKLLDETRDRVRRMYSLSIQDEAESTLMEYPGRALNAKTTDGRPFC
jgi:hypothetical protein